MPEYLSPGVYMEEVDKGPKPIEGVSTSTAAFIGFTEKIPFVKTRKHNGEFEDTPLINQPKLITSWTQYTDKFGGFVEGAYLPYSVYGFFQNGGERCYVISVQKVSKSNIKLLNGKLNIEAKHAGLGGDRLRFKIDAPKESQAETGTAKAEVEAANAKVAKAKEEAKKVKAEAAKAKAGDKAEAVAKVTAAQEKVSKAQAEAAEAKAKEGESSFTITVERQKLDGKWEMAEKLDDITLKLEELEEGNGAKKNRVKVAYKYNRVPQWINIKTQGENLPALTELWQEEPAWQYLKFEREQLPVPTRPKIEGNVADRTGMGSLEALDDVSIVCIPDLMNTSDEKIIRDVQDAIVSHCERMGDRVAILDPLPDQNPEQIRDWRLPDSSYSTLYYPWLEIMDPVQDRPIFIPPSGHIAGIWARTDNTRGVHKAPANEDLRNIIGLEREVTKGEQDILNPNGINCLRSFPRRGTRVWGGRTLSSNPSWRYINIRRLFNFVEQSIERDTQWVVFEPNDPDLWARIRRDVSAFLKGVWRSGALFGLTEDQAFFVKCDEDLNPPEARREGKLFIEIGMAPVYPAEFVIFRIMQWDGSETE